DRLLDAVADRLGEVEADARDLLERGAHLRLQALLADAGTPALARVQAHEGHPHVDALVVGAVLGPALLRVDLAHLRELEQPPPDVEQEALPGPERDARRQLDEHAEITLVELREELGAE